MTRLLYISLLLLCTLPGIAQQIQIKLIDEKSGEPIENAHLSYKNTKAVTNKNGIASINVSRNTEILISHISYNDTTIIVTNPTAKEFIIRLSPKMNTLTGVEISAKPQCIFAPEKTHVFDFEIRNDTLIVLTYQREKMMRSQNRQSESLYLGCQLLLVSPSGNILDSIPLPDYIKSFYTDPLGNIFILAENQILYTEIKSGALEISQVKNDDFQTLIKPLSGSSKTAYFFNDYEWDYPEFNYFALTKNSDNKYLVRTIKDDFTMELFRAEYKYLSNYDKLRAIRLEYKTGIDKEIFGAYMSGFAHHIYYHKLYAPLFNYGDSLFVFDHHSNQIFLHNGTGSNLDSTEIHYHQNRTLKFKDEIINDTKTNSYYGVFEKSGIKALRKIDPFSGESQEIIHFYYSYPEKIKVRNNKIYYIYRKTGGQNTKHLFVEQI